MSPFLRQARQIMEIALRGETEIAIAIDPRGAMRTVDPTGWSLPSLRLEYGAGVVYKVERRAGILRVEGWDGARRCLLERPLAKPRGQSAYMIRAGCTEVPAVSTASRKSSPTSNAEPCAANSRRTISQSSDTQTPLIIRNSAASSVSFTATLIS